MDNTGNIITQGFLMAEELCTSVQCSREKILVRYLCECSIIHWSDFMINISGFISVK